MAVDFNCDEYLRVQDVVGDLSAEGEKNYETYGFGISTRV